MVLVPNEQKRISPRLKHALVADLVLEDLADDGARWLVEPLRDEWEWTEHFARQLGVRTTDGPSGVHESLLMIIREIDEMIHVWPPRHDIAVCRELAHEATKHLSPIELYATLLAGPPQWRRAKIEAGCKVEGLAGHMQPILEKALAAELNRVLGKWVEWDIRKLRERRKEVVEANEAAAREKANAARPSVPRRRPTDRDRGDRLTTLYQPPGRT